VAARFQGKFPKVEVFTVGELFGGWSQAQKRHFDDGGEFDRLYKGPR
jgi:sulfate transport system substrate-binding protein